MSAHEIPMGEFLVRRVLDETFALNKACLELIQDPLVVIGASWGPPWDQPADIYGYSRDEDE